MVAINGGQVPFTSTDQKGNFRIGDGLTIDQTTSTIRGRDFNRAIQAQLTPLILALNKMAIAPVNKFISVAVPVSVGKQNFMKYQQELLRCYCFSKLLMLVLLLHFLK